jgi:hypothetical protein
MLLAGTILLSTQLQSTVCAQVCGFEDFKIHANDGAPDSKFGTSIAVDGAIAIIGAPVDDENGFNYGAAYLVGMASGNEIRKLTATSGAPAAFFGSSVAIDGVQVVIGATNDRISLGAPSTGSAYLLSTILGSQLRRFDPSDGATGDHFGTSVAMNGNVIAVGSPDNESNKGAVYIFDRTTGAQITKLVSADWFVGDQAGSSIAIDGDLMVVGAPRSIVDPPNISEIASIYDLSTMSQVLTFLSASNAAGSGFGSAVDISGNLVVIGAPLADDHGTDAGAAYVFDAATGLFLRELLPSSTFNLNNSQFGSSVAIDGNRVIVGAPTMISGKGEAFIFDLTTGDQLAELKASDPFFNDNFGKSVAMNNFGTLVGAYLDDDLGAQAGAAYRFDPNPTSCPADLTNDCMLNFLDVSAFLAAFGVHDPAADFAPDGMFNFLDVSAFLSAYGEGCP